jgi:hypothetical protein
LALEWSGTVLLGASCGMSVLVVVYGSIASSGTFEGCTQYTVPVGQFPRGKLSARGVWTDLLVSQGSDPNLDREICVSCISVAVDLVGSEAVAIGADSAQNERSCPCQITREARVWCSSGIFFVNARGLCSDWLRSELVHVVIDMTNACIVSHEATSHDRIGIDVSCRCDSGGFETAMVKRSRLNRPP